MRTKYDDTEPTTIEERITKMRLAFRLYQETYKSLMLNAKFSHYNAVVKLQYLYTAETISRKRLSEIEKKERKCFRKILGPPTYDTFTFHLRSNIELYANCEKLSEK